MKTLNIILFCLLFLTFNSYSQSKIDTIAFNLQSGLLSFNGKLNGVESTFAFDTGASIGVLNSKNIASANIKERGKKKISDSQGATKTIGKGKIESIQIGSYVFNNNTTAITDMPFLYCNNFFLLGADVINKLNWKFDFEKNIAYISNKSFEPEVSMDEVNVKFINNRHFTDIKIGDKLLKNYLIDFGYTGFLEVDTNENVFQKLIQDKKAKNEILEAKTFSMGVNSMSVGKKVSTFFIDSLIIGSTAFNQVKLNVLEKTNKKLGLAFFSKYCSSIILNNTDFKYWLQPTNKPFEKKLGFDADCFINNGKLEVVAITMNQNSSAINLSIGEEIKSIDERTASSFSDTCEFINWRMKLSNKTTFVIEKLTGEKIIIKKSVIQPEVK